MKILVTGGAGFVGSHIVDKLSELNYQVVVVDNLATGKHEYIKPGIRFYPMDLRNWELEQIFQIEKPDVVIHQAAQVSVQKSMKAPLKDCSVNVMATINLLDCCVKYNVRKIIYASSAAVYGPAAKLPINEQETVSPMSFYGLSKLTSEQYIQAYSRLYPLEFTILRYANIYGPRQNTQGEAGVIALFVQQFINDENIVIYGDGTQTRDFVYVEDVVNANIAALNNGNNHIYNIGTNQETSINKVFNTIKEQGDQTLQCNYRPKQPGDIERSCLLNKKALNDLKWKPSTSLEKGIIKVIEDFSKS
ncbi:NAD-dependent epimerase/dehydratase family protein [Virgibacillus halodenitrificans]|nr:NAD-dependent epimerase/dehydratase family protein [Virgibacillus halodenitrificans]